MANEELILKLSILEQQANEVRQQLESINQQAQELEILKLSLQKLEQSKGKEMLASLGKGIFIKTEIQDEKLLVNVGNKILVKKSAKETVELVDSQLNEMENIKVQLEENMHAVNHELEHLMEEAKNAQKSAD